MKTRILLLTAILFITIPQVSMMANRPIAAVVYEQELVPVERLAAQKKRMSKHSNRKKIKSHKMKHSKKDIQNKKRKKGIAMLIVGSFFAMALVFIILAAILGLFGSFSGWGVFALLGVILLAIVAAGAAIPNLIVGGVLLKKGNEMERIIEEDRKTPNAESSNPEKLSNLSEGMLREYYEAKSSLEAIKTKQRIYDKMGAKGKAIKLQEDIDLKESKIKELENIDKLAEDVPADKRLEYSKLLYKKYVIKMSIARYKERKDPRANDARQKYQKLIDDIDAEIDNLWN